MDFIKTFWLFNKVTLYYYQKLIWSMKIFFKKLMDQKIELSCNISSELFFFNSMGTALL